MPTFLSCQWINPHLCGCSWVYQPEVDLTLNPLQIVEAGMFSPHVLVVFFPSTWERTKTRMVQFGLRSHVGWRW
jgi:hypothetical protein